MASPIQHECTRKQKLIKTVELDLFFLIWQSFSQSLESMEQKYSLVKCSIEWSFSKRKFAPNAGINSSPRVNIAKIKESLKNIRLIACFRLDFSKTLFTLHNYHISHPLPMIVPATRYRTTEHCSQLFSSIEKLCDDFANSNMHAQAHTYIHTITHSQHTQRKGYK